MSKITTLSKYILLIAPFLLIGSSAIAYIGIHVGHRPGGSYYRHHHPLKSYGYYRYHKPYGYHYYHRGPYGYYNYGPYYGHRVYRPSYRHHYYRSYEYDYRMPSSIVNMNERQANLMNRVSNMNLYQKKDLRALREKMLDARRDFAKNYADYEYMLRNNNRQYIQLNRHDLERNMATLHNQFMDLYGQFKELYQYYKTR